MVIKMMNDKKGWIRIVEASMAVLFITGVVLMVINQNKANGTDEIALNILTEEVSVLRGIQLDDSLREDVLAVNSLPVGSEEVGFPESIKSKISSMASNHLGCSSKICSITGDCILDEKRSEDVYAESVIITTTTSGSSYSPKKLKIFCWVK